MVPAEIRTSHDASMRRIVNNWQGCLTRQDYLALGVSALIFLVTVAISVFVNHSRFYNPFI